MKGILRKPRSRLLTTENGYCVTKQLSDKAKQWLDIHDRTNWKEIGLLQEYLKHSKKTKKIQWITWKLPGVEKPKETCGQWKYKGCLNHTKHPDHKSLIRKFWISCFRSCCKKCWLEKWLARESNRATRRIENFIQVKVKYGFREPKPIHVIVSPPWNEKFSRFDVLKNRCRKMMRKAGIVGGLMIYHPFSFDKDKGEWVIRPHFHVVGFGWVVDTKKISDNDGWVIKNKGVRDNLHSTIYYQLSHAGVSNELHSKTEDYKNPRRLHSIIWFGDLGYRAKYASEIKVEDDEIESKLCQFCCGMLQEVEYIGTDRPPPPDIEFEALLNHNDWKNVDSQNYNFPSNKKPTKWMNQFYDANYGISV